MKSPESTLFLMLIKSLNKWPQDWAIERHNGYSLRHRKSGFLISRRQLYRHGKPAYAFGQVTVETPHGSINYKALKGRVLSWFLKDAYLRLERKINRDKREEIHKEAIAHFEMHTTQEDRFVAKL